MQVRILSTPPVWSYSACGKPTSLERRHGESHWTFDSSCDRQDGEVAECFKALVLKTSVVKATVGWNPTFSSSWIVWYASAMPYKDKAEQYRYQEQWRKRRRDEWFAANGPCVKCGSCNDLELDHENPATKVSHRIWSWCREKREAELKKCRPMCSKCHLEKTKVDLRVMDVNAHLRMTDPEGKAWCYSGKHFTEVENFTKNKAKRRGLENDCRLCRSKRRSEGVYRTALQYVSAGETVDSARL